MRIAIASGKGGTGKTTIAASLASIWNEKLLVIDLDVEEPNLHLFLKPEIKSSKKTYVEVPRIDNDKCISCGKCSEICNFNAISIIGNKVMVFPDMCHSCGGCFRVCPVGAIIRDKREIGEIITGNKGNTDFIMGKLRIGEAMSPPLMREIKKNIKTINDIIIDAPPGTSCPAINAVIDCDFIVMVTEPTPFGLHDMKLAREAFDTLGIKMGVVINKAGIGNRDVYDYCKKTNLPILTEIPFDRKIAKAYSESKLISEMSKEYKDIFLNLKKEIKNA